MKTSFLMFFVLMLLATLNANANLPPTTLKGQSGTKATTFNFEVPNNQATRTSTGGLLETGNKNLLKDPSFEASTLDAAWVCTTNGVVSQESTIRHHGLKALKIELTADTFECVQDTTINATYLAGSNLTASGRVNSNFSGAYICSRNDGTTLTTNCGIVNTDGTFKIPTAVPFIGSSTSQGISITSKGVAVTGTLYADDMDISPTVLNTQDQSRIAGEAYIVSATCDTLTRSSTTVGPFTVDTGCPGPVVNLSSMGTWLTTDSDLPRFSVNNLPAGKYKATMLFNQKSASSGSAPTFAINDGTTTCTSLAGFDSTTLAGQIVSCVFDYQTSGNRVFELYASSAGGTLVTVSPWSGTGFSAALKFQLEYFGSSQTYTSQCGANCVDTFSAKVSAAGVVSEETPSSWISGNASISDTSLFAITFDTGILTVKPHCWTEGINAGIDYQAVTGIEATSSGVSLRTNQGASKGASEFLLFCRKQGADFVATRTIQGSFAEVNVSPGVTKPKTCHYAFGGASATLASPTECTTGTCVEVYDSCGTGTPPAWATVSVYNNLTFTAGTFANSSYVHCSCVAWDITAGTSRACEQYFDTSDQSWQASATGGYVLNMFTSDGLAAGATSYIQATCTGSAP